MRCQRTLCILLFLAATSIGCGGQGLHHWHKRSGLNDYDVPMSQAAVVQNPMYVPLSDREFLWNQIVDTLDNYFRIEREERVRLLGGVMTEGRIETFPVVGATYLEPWRRDSSRGFERLYSTLQSMRRRAVVRVLPQTDGGYMIDVAVFKELEDLDRPDYSSVSTKILRSDGTIVRPGKQEKPGPITLDWIPLGRDVQLEQRILAELRDRLGLGVNR